MHLYFARSRQSKNKQTKNKEKIHGKRYNTIPVATYIMAIGMTRQKNRTVSVAWDLHTEERHISVFNLIDLMTLNTCHM